MASITMTHDTTYSATNSVISLAHNTDTPSAGAEATVHSGDNSVHTRRTGVLVGVCRLASMQANGQDLPAS